MAETAARGAAMRRVLPGARRGISGHLAFYVMAAAFALVAFLPMVWILDTSLKPLSQLTTQPPTYLPWPATLQNYVVAFAQQPFARYYLNSAVVSVAATAACLALASLAGYAIARLRFRWKRVVLIGILSASLFPPITQLLPLYNVMQTLGLLNNYLALIIPYTFHTLPMAIWLLSAYLRDIPRDLEEAAMVDGAGRMRALLRVVLPLSSPGLVTTGVIVFVYDWNEFLFSLTFMTQQDMRTIPVGIALYQGQYSFPWGTISAATVMAVIPLVLLILFFQRRLIAGLTAGAVK